MARWAFLFYGLGCYVIFFATFIYLMGFIINLWVPKGIDSGTQLPIVIAVLIDLGLILLFGLQHSIMARPGFKKWWKKIIPEPIERSTYVLFTSLALLIMFWLWAPIPITLWHVDNFIGSVILYSIYAVGCSTVLITTLLINHFDLFGLRQVYYYWRQKPYSDIAFMTPGPYQYVRHPLYVGLLMMFWAATEMSLGHLFFSIGLTLYILIGVYFEEKDLTRYFPEYTDYKRRVPSLLPGFLKSK